MINWDNIDSVFLDMDGTLLDLHFDNYFWLEHVPIRYAEDRGMSLDVAKQELIHLYKRVEGTLEWYCVDHWSRQLGLDIVLLKQEVDHLIDVHPHVMDFLEQLGQAGKRRVLVTNAHQKALQLKMERTRLAGHFERVICAHDIGLAKEEDGFWPKLRAVESFDPRRTLFVDDNISVLRAARQYGIAWLLAVRQPDTRQPSRDIDEFPAIRDFSEVMPGDASRDNQD